jgi:dTDP-3-amino-3,4,6-trideoxy-alpha-D-glucose transaminase
VSAGAGRTNGFHARREIPLTRLDNSDPELLAELMEAVGSVARRAAFVLGDEVDAFEEEFAAYCEVDEAVGVSSGTDALVLALRALEVGPGHDVILPANSFIATAEAVSLVGATPRLVDVDPVTRLMTAAAVEAAIGLRTRAVIPVHLYGRTAPLDSILEVARRAGVAVIEDACQAHGARYRGRRTGSLGDCGCFSFYPAKNLGAWGDGGAVVTHDAGLAERIRLLRSHGERPRYRHRMVGTTARLDAIQAAVLRVKLRRLDRWNAQRRGIAVRLARWLRGSALVAPAMPSSGEDHVFHQFVVETDHRDELREHLRRQGVASGIHYPAPIHRSPAYEGLGLGEGSLPVSERLARRICSLPIFPGMTPEELERVGSAAAVFVPDDASLFAAVC